MKKKIIIGAFLLLVLVTSAVFLIGAIESYNYDTDPANGVDILEGVGAAMLIMVGGIAVLCEIDLFFTVYYFLIKPKTLSKSIFMILSQLMLLPVIFGRDFAYFLFQRVSGVFGEEIIVIGTMFILYVILRIVCVTTCYSQKE